MKVNSTKTQTKRMLVVGTNGTGKTTFASKLADKTVNAGGRVLVVVKNDLIWESAKMITHEELTSFKGLARILFRSNDTLQAIAANYKNGLLVLDDARNFIRPNLQDDVINMLIDSRHNKVNIVTVAHGFSQVPPAFFTFATHFVIFKTTDNVQKRANEVNDFVKVERTVKRVNFENARLAVQGKGTYYFEIIPN